MKDFSPLQQVIPFDKEEPAIGWVSSTRIHPGVVLCDTQGQPVMVWVAHHEQDAQEGRGRWLPVRQVQPYTDDLWAACERWIAQRRQHRQDFEMLRKGKIPDAQLVLWEA